VLQSEAIEAAMPRPTLPTRRPSLPLHVEPASDEALLSWLLRLASRLGVSLHVLASQSFGIDDRSGHTRWWCRPHPWVLARISERTGVSVLRLRRMTFEGLEPAYRDDEASARFAGRRYDAGAAEHPAHRFAACGSCLEGDEKPYLRTSWLIGWMAVCPHHGTILIERCKACGASLRVAPFTVTASFSAAICTRCGWSLLDGRYAPAHPAVARMQTELLRGKRSGVLELEGLGRLTWPEMVALADVLIGMVWTDLTLAEQEEIFLLYISDPLTRSAAQDAIYDCRHGSLQFLAWLTSGWTESVGVKIGRSMLMRWLAADRNRLCRHLRAPSADPWNAGPSNFEPPIRRRLQALADAT
jgi:TniQ